MNAMTTTTRLTCTTCEFEIAGRPEFHVGLPFCCAGCVVGGPCLCSYDVLEEARSVADAAGPLAVEPSDQTDPWPVSAGLAGVSRI